MELNFFAYGAPKGFDLFYGAPEDKAYFQSTYYDGSKEESKLIIHRRNNGKVVYSYLKYDLLDADGRPGSFFGISAELDGKYFFDNTGFYQLFEQLFETILQEGVLLVKNKENKTVFKVRDLKSAGKEIKRIFSILQNNINNYFTKYLFNVDEDFKRNVNENKVYKLNPDSGNDIIKEVFKEYPMLSLSHTYEVIESNPFGEDNSSEKLSNDMENENFQPEESSDSKEKAQQYKQAETIADEGLDAEKKGDLKQNNTRIENRIDKECSSSTRDFRSKEILNKKNISRRYKSIFFILIITLILLIFFRPKSNTLTPVATSDSQRCFDLIEGGNQLLQQNKFDDAITAFKAAKSECANVSNHIDRVYNQAVGFYKGKAEAEFNSIDRRKIDSYYAAIRDLEFLKKYHAENEYKIYVEEYRNKAIGYYYDVIDTTSNKDLRRIYAEFILQLDAYDKKAKEILK